MLICKFNHTLNLLHYNLKPIAPGVQECDASGDAICAIVGLQKWVIYWRLEVLAQKGK